MYGSTAARLSKILTVINSITGLDYMFEADRASVSTKVIQKVVLNWYKFALSNTEVIFQNEEDLEFLKEKGLIDNAKTHVISSSGVNINKFLPRYIQDDIPILGLLERIVRAKGVETFVKAAKWLKEKELVVIKGSKQLGRLVLRLYVLKIVII